MLLATTTVEDSDRFASVFSIKGPEKRRQHGSKGSHVFRDPNRQATHKGPPDVAEFTGSYDA